MLILNIFAISAIILPSVVAFPHNANKHEASELQFSERSTDMLGTGAPEHEAFSKRDPMTIFSDPINHVPRSMAPPALPALEEELPQALPLEPTPKKNNGLSVLSQKERRGLRTSFKGMFSKGKKPKPQAASPVFVTKPPVYRPPPSYSYVDPNPRILRPKVASGNQPFRPPPTYSYVDPNPRILRPKVVSGNQPFKPPPTWLYRAVKREASRPYSPVRYSSPPPYRPPPSYSYHDSPPSRPMPPAQNNPPPYRPPPTYGYNNRRVKREASRPYSPVRYSSPPPYRPPPSYSYHDSPPSRPMPPAQNNPPPYRPPPTYGYDNRRVKREALRTPPLFKEPASYSHAPAPRPKPEASPIYRPSSYTYNGRHPAKQYNRRDASAPYRPPPTYSYHDPHYNNAPAPRPPASSSPQGSYRPPPSYSYVDPYGPKYSPPRYQKREALRTPPLFKEPASYSHAPAPRPKPEASPIYRPSSYTYNGRHPAKQYNRRDASAPYRPPPTYSYHDPHYNNAPAPRPPASNSPQGTYRPPPSYSYVDPYGPKYSPPRYQKREVPEKYHRVKREALRTPPLFKEPASYSHAPAPRPKPEASPIYRPSSYSYNGRHPAKQYNRRDASAPYRPPPTYSYHDPHYNNAPAPRPPASNSPQGTYRPPPSYSYVDPYGPKYSPPRYQKRERSASLVKAYQV